MNDGRSDTRSNGSLSAMWRAMTEDDLAAVHAMSEAVHAGYPERLAIFAEKRALHPGGCFVLDEDGAGMAGYAFAHPFLTNRSVPLDGSLGALPVRPDCLYVHDVALAPSARGQGHAARLLGRLGDHACSENLPRLALVALPGATAFWRRHGFAASADALMAEKLASYGPGATYMTREVG